MHPVAADVSPRILYPLKISSDLRRRLRFSKKAGKRKHFLGCGWLVCFVFWFAAGTITVTAQPSTHRPAHWAQKVEVAGIKNCFQVTTNLYRGAQPGAEGMKQLKAIGIKTVINLREFHSDKNKVAGADLKSMRLKTEPWHGSEEVVVRFLKVVTDTNNLPAFVHCERGADRTGMMCAMYRVVVCGWSKQEAVAEMKNGGFGFNPVWHELVKFVETADVDKIRREAGLAGK